ncbi:MAG: sigma-70 family RNA polymerase sigma factor [Lachnospiraceae bacterium]|nr:sigma-70 family RNA polymerase sigma factor [Lachnospiraceae bacterium]
MFIFEEPLSADEEKKYLELMGKGDKTAKDILIERNLRLVAHVVKRYSKDEKDMEDLISVGTIGLIKAINTYNPDKGNKLATYAARCIENEILMMYRSEKKKSRDISLNEPIGTDKEGNTINLIDIIEEKNSDVFLKVENSENINKLKSYMAKYLTPREREIVSKRYGLEEGKTMTQKEIGRYYNISRSYVSRIEKRALIKLKKAFDNSYKK